MSDHWTELDEIGFRLYAHTSVEVVCEWGIHALVGPYGCANCGAQT